ncbi:major fimbrial subunit protein FimA [Dysgonomonas alginatilytica]|uniref:Major fimbrial subunit protein FimA n=1 Tax=Dysgonomonas alginatilytica TaxID=1605892 RepID=A0A2V3PSY3_9BACT|nr:fimbrial protein [Dysgonomonas alginatilytica]PXV66347.1 major fimbrial subunit protein FimA [Dysgonomonas alginatilytica]
MKKLKLLFLPLIAAALLSSCSNSETNSDSGIPEVGTPAMLRIELKSLIENSTRASGTPTRINESHIGLGTIMVFKAGAGNNILDGYATFDFTGGTTTVLVPITAGPRDIYVVANNTLSDFHSITQVSDLYNLTSKADLTSQNGSNLAMSGFTLGVNASNATVSSPATASVNLNFVASRVSMDWDLSQLPPIMAGFEVTRAYLLNVKSESDWFSSASNVSLTQHVNSFFNGLGDTFTFSGSYLPVPPATNSFNSILNMTDVTTGKGFANNYFYVWENSSTFPTIVVIEGSLSGNTYYYPIVINGDLNGTGPGGSTNGGNKSSTVTRGNIYNVRAIIKGFGATDPYAPLSPAAIDVTITTATWNPIVSIDQEFN